MDDPVGIDDAVVVGVEQFLRAHLGHFHRAAHGSEDLELRRIVRIVGRPVVRIGVKHAEHLVLAAREDLVLQAHEEVAVVLAARFGEPLAEIADGLVGTHMHRGLAPVAGAPEHIDPGPVQVVRQDLIQFVRILVFEDGLHARGGIGGGCIGHIGFDAVFHRVRIRLLGIAVQGEMVPPGGLADDEDAYGRTVIRERRIRQGDLLHVLPLFRSLVAEGIDNVGPWHQEAA